ncbi:MAG: cysteine--tRNA ligase [Candidatus Omnitrophica bacterium]|nr:cysteine--tRNA ligase [Candidatus Omnitrophota bacterium]
MKISNTLTRQREELIPIKGKTINMYSCGVTVYDKCHIGHARSLYIFDVIRRYLIHRGYDVRFVRNITDVDDKIIKRAQESGQSFEDVVEQNIQAYYADLKALHIQKADIEPRATENIGDMIRHIEKLISDGFAYESGGNVYFHIRKFPTYGQLSKQSIEYMQEAVRIDQDEQKKDPLDFALWKTSKPGEPAWDSPWGKGRPGWHIECSCMSMRHLKTETLDIHAGGRDLIFPHHENEIAQSEAYTGKPFAKYWIHHGLLTINGQKMAKSLGNFITVEDALKKYSADQLKIFFLSAHYESPIDFTEKSLLEARENLNTFKRFFKRVADLSVEEIKQTGPNDHPTDKFHQQVLDALDDNFNTAKALGIIFEWMSGVHKSLDGQQANLSAAHAASVLMEGILRDIFGLSIVEDFPAEKSILEAFREDQLAPDQAAKIEERARAKNNKDFKRADEIRDQLKAQGIIIEDGPSGTTWRRA